MENDKTNYMKIERSVTLDDGSTIYYHIDVVGDINSNTPVLLFNPGAGFEGDKYANGYDCDYIDEAIRNNDLGCDSIIIASYNRVKNGGSMHGVDVVDDVIETYGLSSSNVVFSGFSDGGQECVKQTAEFCRRHEEVINPNVLLIDAYSFKHIEKQEMQILADRDAVVYGIANAKYDQTIISINKKYASEGIHFIQIEDGNCKDRNARFNNAHQNVCYNVFNSGVVGYVVGQGEFPNKKFINVYNEETDFYLPSLRRDPESCELVDFDIRGKWRNEVYGLLGINVFLNLTYGEKSDKLMTLKNISISDMTRNLYYVRSDYELLELRLNGIISEIRNSTVARETPDYMAFMSSTSKVPKEIPNVVYEYFNVSANLLLSLDRDCGEFAKVGLSIEQMSANFERDASQL